MRVAGVHLETLVRRLERLRVLLLLVRAVEAGGNRRGSEPVRLAAAAADREDDRVVGRRDGAALRLRVADEAGSGGIGLLGRRNVRMRLRPESILDCYRFDCIIGCAPMDRLCTTTPGVLLR